MELVTLPVEMLDSSEYDAMRMTDKQFLIDLYILFGDCETFTIDMERPQEYRQRLVDRRTMYLKIKGLLDSGLIVATLQPNENGGRHGRIYSFKYKVQ